MSVKHIFIVINTHLALKSKQHYLQTNEQTAKVIFNVAKTKSLSTLLTHQNCDSGLQMQKTAREVITTLFKPYSWT